MNENGTESHICMSICTVNSNVLVATLVIKVMSPARNSLPRKCFTTLAAPVSLFNTWEWFLVIELMSEFDQTMWDHIHLVSFYLKFENVTKLCIRKIIFSCGVKSYGLSALAFLLINFRFWPTTMKLLIFLFHICASVWMYIPDFRFKLSTLISYFGFYKLVTQNIVMSKDGCSSKNTSICMYVYHEL